EPGAVLRHHQRNLKLVEPIGRHREADQAAAVLRHEVDGFRRDLFGSDRQIALVLAILVVHDNYDAARTYRRNRVVDPGKGPRPFACSFGNRDLSLQCVASPGRTGSSVRPASSAARTTYLPTMSHSRFTRSPTFACPRLVCSRVNGTSCTSKQPAPSP